MPLQNLNNIPIRGGYRYNPTVSKKGTSTPQTGSSVSFNPLGLLGALPAIPALFSYAGDTEMSIGAEDIYNLYQGQRGRIESATDQAQKDMLSALYGRGLYKAGETVGDIANLRGREQELMTDVDAQMVQALMQLNQQELQAGLAQKERHGDIGQLFASLGTLLPFLL